MSMKNKIFAAFILLGGCAVTETLKIRYDNVDGGCSYTEYYSGGRGKKQLEVFFTGTECEDIIARELDRMYK